MKIKTEVNPKYFVLDILPVEESLTSQYEDIAKEEIIGTELYKYIDLNDDKLYSPRLQLVFDIQDGKNVYLTRFDCLGYNVYAYDAEFKYNLHLKIYPDSTRIALITGDNKIIKKDSIECLPSSFVDKNEGVIYDDYINLDIQGSKVINFSNADFFKDIEKLFS